jgi:signal transduction histidine kinase
MAAHDLRAPLAVVKGYVEMVMHESALDEEGMGSLGVVLTRVGQMASLIDNLLDVEKIESGEVALHREPLDLALIVRQVGDGFSLVARQKAVRLEWDVPLELAQPNADRERMAQVLNNLVSNAIQFTPPGGHVTIRAFQQDSEIAVEVSDTGCGISEADQAHLFERFFRAPEARQRRLSGTGLGLSIVKAIVEQHGGHVTCRSQLGQGSTFGFSLPLEEG